MNSFTKIEITSLIKIEITAEIIIQKIKSIIKDIGRNLSSELPGGGGCGKPSDIVLPKARGNPGIRCPEERVSPCGILNALKKVRIIGKKVETRSLLLF